jgi:hypothetical protein
MAISIDLAIGSVATSGGGGTVGTGFLQITGGVLDTTLRNVTDNSATPVVSPLQLSTTQAVIQYPTGIYNGSFALRGGDNSGAGIPSFLDFIPSTSALGYYHAIGFAYDNSNWLGFYRGSRTTPALAFGNNLIWAPNYNVAFGHTSASARLHVRGDGTNPIARFEASGGLRSLAIESSGDLIRYGTGDAGMYILNQSGSSSISGQAIGWQTALSSFAGHGFRIFNVYDQTYTSGTGGLLDIGALGGTFAAAAGSANFRPLSITYTINNSGAQTGTATGIFLNATETALNGMTHNLMDLQGGDTGGLSVFRVSKNRVSSARFETIVRLGGGSDTAQHFIYGGEGNSTGIILDRGSSNVSIIGSFSTTGITSLFSGVVYVASNYANVQANLGVGFFGNGSARLHVRGDGSAKVVRFDSGAGTELWSIVDNGVIVYNNSNTAIQGSTTGFDFYGSVAVGSNSRAYGFYGRSSNFTSGTGKYFDLDLGGALAYNPNSGNAQMRFFNLEYTVAPTGANTAIATGIYVNATEGTLNGMGHNLMDLKVGGESRIKVDNAGRVFTGNSIIIQIGSSLSWSDRTVLNAPADGNLRITNSAGNNFGLLQLGGTTNAFPAIKRNGAELEARFADDSGFCNFQAAVGRFTGFSTSAFTNNFALGSNANIKQKLVIEDGSPTAITASALVELKSTTLGFLPPRMTDTEVRTITTPAEGLVVFNTTISHLCIFASNSWHKLNYSGM